MRPIFTIHAGEYLVGSEIERRLRHANLWVPSRDTGVDLLVSDRKNRRTVSLQVKFSRDFLVTHMPRTFQKRLRACGWWTIEEAKLRRSPADLWVLVVQGFGQRASHFVILPPAELLRRLRSIHGKRKRFQTYLWITEDNHCWETRELPRKDQERIVDGMYHDNSRDLSRWLNAWSPIDRLGRKT
jgi:hypothetical protein